jgi:hypothetical protein
MVLESGLPSATGDFQLVRLSGGELGNSPYRYDQRLVTRAANLKGDWYNGAMLPSPPAPLAASRRSIAAFGATILLGAFLLFQMQPLVSKAILPWFGGCPAVWTTCMLFFQTLLFGGYLYAHLLQRWLAPRTQAGVHLVLIAVAIGLLPILPGPGLKPADSSYPTWRILLLLTMTAGLPYFALSATSPLVQTWFSSRCPGRSPYRLYALSNAGSLAALLSYPFLFEPAFDLPRQSALWSGGFALYAALCAVSLACLWSCSRHTPCAIADGTRRVPATCAPVTWLDRLCWLALPACASLMLLAATNHICQDVAVVPFLWVVPLSLYLLSFIVCFDHQRWYARRVWAAAAVLGLAGVVANDYFKQSHPLGLMSELALNAAALFFVCMVCHGELARAKPGPRHLTEFYLLIAAGGALGGMFVAVVAPLLFSMYLEWQIGVTASFLLAVGLLVLPGRAGKRGVIHYTVVAPAVAVIFAYLFYWGFDAAPPVDRARNFFGVVTVKDWLPHDPEKHELLLVHGRITHGRQSADPDKRRWATSYYGYKSGLGQAISYLHKSGPIRIGAIGLGVGTVATYARPGDLVRFYEINPQVLRMARQHFTYLADCRGTYEVRLGDARLSLEAEQPPQQYDLLVLDAFSGDAIPTHLLTREAFDSYLGHLAPGGVIAVHISNTYLDLAPVVRRLAEYCRLETTQICDEGNDNRLTDPSDWMLVTRSDKLLRACPSKPPEKAGDDRRVRLWTDQYSNLFQIISGG